MLASRSGSILAGDSARSTGKGYSAGDARRDPLAGCSGGILGGIHWRATLAQYSAGSTGELLWDTQLPPRADCLTPLANHADPVRIAEPLALVFGLCFVVLWSHLRVFPRCAVCGALTMPFHPGVSATTNPAGGTSRVAGPAEGIWLEPPRGGV